MKVPGIKQKFKEVYNAHTDALFRYCVMRVNDRNKAIDIVQDIFTELWKIYNTDEVIRNPKAYLYTLAHNRIIDWYRKKKSQSLDALMENEETPFEPADEKAHKDIVSSAEAKRVLKAIGKLEDTYREVLELRFTEDLSPQEIAEILETNANTVSIRITRGLEKLREEFDL